MHSHVSTKYLMHLEYISLKCILYSLLVTCTSLIKVYFWYFHIYFSNHVCTVPNPLYELSNFIISKRPPLVNSSYLVTPRILSSTRFTFHLHLRHLLLIIFTHSISQSLILKNTSTIRLLRLL